MLHGRARLGEALQRLDRVVGAVQMERPVQSLSALKQQSAEETEDEVAAAALRRTVAKQLTAMHTSWPGKNMRQLDHIACIQNLCASDTSILLHAVQEAATLEAIAALKQVRHHLRITHDNANKRIACLHAGAV